MVKRVFVIVLDSFGVGHGPDADKFGDNGSNTLASIIKSKEYHTPNLEKLGLFQIDQVEGGKAKQTTAGAYGRMEEASMGKDTTTGHWELAGLISKTPMPVYPHGFPAEILEELKAQTGRAWLCNKPYSGTDVIRDYGEEQMHSGDWIIYTSADSVLQIAAHEQVIPLEELYEACRTARGLMQGEHGVGRVIARPYAGEPGSFYRTPHRHDFSLDPPGDTMLDVLVKEGMTTIGVGKIYDIFAGKGVQRTVSIESNKEGMERTLEFQKEDFNGLCFANLVDFDMLYGHRNDVHGYARAMSEFDVQLGEFLHLMREEDVLFITADHGCDPAYPGTDHTRECVPLLVCGEKIKAGVNLHTRRSFADLSATVQELLGVKIGTAGCSFLPEIEK